MPDVTHHLREFANECEGLMRYTLMCAADTIEALRQHVAESHAQVGHNPKLLMPASADHLQACQKALQDRVTTLEIQLQCVQAVMLATVDECRGEHGIGNVHSAVLAERIANALEVKR